MRRVFVALLAVLAVVGTVPSADAAAAGYHWGGNGERTPNIVASISETWRSAFDAAVGDWDASNYIEMDITEGRTTNRVRQNCRFADGYVHVCNGGWTASWAGLTEITYNSSNRHIIRGRARLNGRLANTPGLRRAVTCHELGHAIGLAHSPQTSTSCMKPSVSTSSNQPNSGNYTDLRNIYEHGHGGGGAGVADHDVEITRNGPYVTVRIATYLSPA